MGVFVYHLVPENMIGKILFPLNILQQTNPNAAAPHFRKYQGRVKLLEERIPLLNCLWNDVLMFSPVHPAKLKQALQLAGHIRPSWCWYEIDARRLDCGKAIIFLPSQLIFGQFHLREVEFLPFRVELLDRLSEVPEMTKEYYAEVKPGEPLFVFTGIPHVLYRGQVDITSAVMLEV